MGLARTGGRLWMARAPSRQARRQGAQGGERSVGAAESEQFVRGSSRSVAGVEQKQRQQQRQRANKR